MKIHPCRYARLLMAACLSLAIAFAPTAEAARKKAAARPPSHKKVHLKPRHGQPPPGKRHGKYHQAQKLQQPTRKHVSHHAARVPAHASHVVMSQPRKPADSQPVSLPLARKSDNKAKAASSPADEAQIEDQVPPVVARQACRLEGKVFFLADCDDLLPLLLTQNSVH